MFWADRIAKDIIQSGKFKPYWVDDMKTPSGRIHVGGLRAVTTHDIVYKALLDQGVVRAKFTYVFDNHDPMDSLPNYLPKEYEKYLGMPLFMIPSPEKGFKDYAECFAKEFQDGFRRIDCNPEIIWTTDLYFSGKINDGIRKCLDNADKIRKIYEDLYKKKIAKDWYPFNVYCPNCGKVSTTRVTGWDGKEVAFECRVDAVNWTKGCGHKSSISPFATKDKINGKLPWKVEWAVKWQAIGITIEGAGKDHMTAGGSHDLAKRVAEEILDYRTPYAFAHEFFLIGGRKMSTSKGAGISVVELLEILPPELVRFLIVKTKLNQAIDFDPGGDTIPKLFDDYQKVATSSDEDLKRIFKFSQVTENPKPLPKTRFIDLVQAIQSPNIKIEEDAKTWVPYARIWLERFAPEEIKFKVTDVKVELSSDQKKYLLKVAGELDKEWDPEELQAKLYDWAKELNIPTHKAFAGIYLSLFGKKYGPKAAWVILENKKLIKKKFSK